MQNLIMRHHRAFMTRASIFLIVLLLAGCSMVRIGYNNGESIAYWWLNSYVDFDSDQQPWVRHRIGNLLAWHRKTQLKDYAQLLALARNRLQQPDSLSMAELSTHYDEYKARAFLMADQALPDLADLALNLRPQQIAHIEKEFASNNDAYRKDFLRGDVEHRQRFRYKKVLKQAEFWFGSFSREQERLIRAASDARPLNNELWMAERVLRQQELIGLLKKIQTERPQRDVAMAMLKEYIASFDRDNYGEHYGVPARKPFFDVYRESTFRMMVAIVNLTTPAQKAHAAQRMQNWIDDFNALASKG